MVMHNASFHLVQFDKPPTFSSRKSQMQERLGNSIPTLELTGKNFFTEKRYEKVVMSWDLQITPILLSNYPY